MAITYSCDRCGFKSVKTDAVKRYTVEIKAKIKAEKPAQTCIVDLCDKCLETAWNGINEQLFRRDKQLS